MATRYDNSLSNVAYQYANETLKESEETFRSFLSTMAKFHKYSWEAQALLHRNAPDGISVVASEAFWENQFGGSVKDTATLIPLTRPRANGAGYEDYFVVDVKDTTLPETDPEKAEALLWKYHEEDQEAVLAALGEEPATSISEAVSAAVADSVQNMPEGMRPAYAAAVEYIIRERLGIVQQDNTLAAIPLESIRIDEFLNGVNTASRGILDRVGKAIQEAEENRKENRHETGGRDQAGGLRPREVERSDGGISQAGTSRGISRDEGDGDAGELSSESREGNVNRAGTADAVDLRKGRNIVSAVQREDSTNEVGRTGEHVEKTSGGDFERRVQIAYQDFMERIQGERNWDGLIDQMETAKDRIELHTNLVNAILNPKYADLTQYAVLEKYFADLQETLPRLRMELMQSMAQTKEESQEEKRSQEEGKQEVPQDTVEVEHQTEEQSQQKAQEEEHEEIAAAVQDDLFSLAGKEQQASAEKVDTPVASSDRPYSDVYDKMMGFYRNESPTNNETAENTAEDEIEVALSDSVKTVEATKEEVVDEKPKIIDPPFMEDEIQKLDFEATMFSTSGKRSVFQRNLVALQIVRHLDETGNLPNENELRVLRAYSGFGGLSEAFDSENTSWKAENNAIKGVLTETEYASARRSTLSAFYTPDEVVAAIYEGLQAAGFNGGNILDPSTGSGRFLRELPKEMREKSSLTGIELDSLSARVAHNALGDARILNNRFEKTTFPDNSFDLAITNVPFEDVVISDPRYEQSYSVHDYFIRRMMDQARPGGLVVAITSSDTMDKKNPTLRQELARKGELVRAIRLPNTLFHGAGTSVCTDLLIFRKREQELAQDAPLPAWVDTVSNTFTWNNEKKDREESLTFQTNAYFEEHREDILGEMKLKAFAYGPRIYVDGDDYIENIAADLKERLSTLPKDLYHTPAKQLPVPQEKDEQKKNRHYGFYKENEKIVRVYADGKVEPIKTKKEQFQRYSLMIEMRDTMREMFDAELTACSDAELAQYQNKLNLLYQSYVKAYGRIKSDSFLNRSWRDDASYTLFRSLEEFNEKDEFVKLADIFTKRTILAYQAPEHADTPRDAVMVSLQERGKLDFSYMQQLTGMDKEAIIKELLFKEIYYDSKKNEYVPSEDFLSGDVREKIEYTEADYKETYRLLQSRAKEALSGSIAVKESVFTKFHEEDFEVHDSISRLTDEEKIALMKSENRKAFYRAISNTSLTGQIHYFRFLQLNAPDVYKEVTSPRFTVECAANGVVFFPGKSPLRDYLPQWRNVARRLADCGVSYESLRLHDVNNEIVKEYIVGAFRETEGLPDISSEGLEEFRSNYKDRLEAMMQENREPFTSLRERLSILERNKEALERVKPKDLKAEDIKVNLGAGWILPSDVQDFAKEVLGAGYVGHLCFEYSKDTATWNIDSKRKMVQETTNSVAMHSEYGTSHKNAIELLDAVLNHRVIKVYQKEEDGSKTPLPEETMLAQQKADDIREKFSEWIFSNEARKERIVAYYNRHFNNIVPRSYDGSGLVFPGMSPDIELKPHQKDAVARIVRGGNTLLAHVVGAGKSFEMQAAAIESKRVGLCTKSLMIMPKHLTAAFGEEFNRLYPNAKVLVASERDFQTPEKRKEFFARIISQDWDAVVASYEQFQKLPLSQARQEKFIRDEIEYLRDALDKFSKKGKTSRNSFSVKQTEKMLETLYNQLRQTLDRSAKTKDTEYTFEQLGIDRLFVDEAHYYKNLQFVTHMEGLNNGGNQKTLDLLAKVRYLNELTNERGVIFATGTPISNSIAEIYTMQRYLKPSRLEKQGLMHFDAWASTFGREVTAIEVDPAGNGFRAKTRFASFNNIPELTSMFCEFADVKTAEDLKLDVPEHTVEIVKADPSPLQERIVDALGVRADNVASNNPAKRSPEGDPKTKKGMDNVLTIIHDGMSAALDPRILNPNYEDFEGSKVNLCVKNVVDTYRKTSEQKLTQMIFCDISTPTGEKGKFNVYDDMRKKFIENGVKPEEIAVIHDFEKAEDKAKLFARVRKGDVRILIGSTDKLGVGTNAQNLLISAHSLDCPWKPAQLEQRDGRIVRRGNINPNVTIYRYVTGGTFDSFMWQTVERKGRFIGQIMKPGSGIREMEDVDEFSAQANQAKLMTMRNPIYAKMIEKTQELTQLEFSRNAHDIEQKKYKRQLKRWFPDEIARMQEWIGTLEKCMTQIEEGKNDKNLMIQGVPVPHENIGKVLAKIAEGVLDKKYPKTPTGTYQGMRLSFTMDEHRKIHCNVLGATSIRFPIGVTTFAENQKRLENFDQYFQERLTVAKERLANLEREKEQKETFVNTPFAKEVEYQAKKEELEAIKAEVDKLDAENKLEQTKSDRLKVVKHPKLYEGDDKIIKAYLVCAHEEYANSNGFYGWEEDRRVADRMLDLGIKEREVKRVLASCSPMVHDAGSLNATVVSRGKNQVRE